MNNRPKLWKKLLGNFLFILMLGYGLTKLMVLMFTF